jgi:hypothetical protein
MFFFSVLKTGLNIVVACNIPKDSPMLEVIPFLPFFKDPKGILMSEVIPYSKSITPFFIHFMSRQLQKGS